MARIGLSLNVDTAVRKQSGSASGQHISVNLAIKLLMEAELNSAQVLINAH